MPAVPLTATAAAATPWAGLADELDAWAEAGRAATLWWRDDDATADTPALRRLVALAGRHGVPVAVAAVPAKADATLAACLAGAPGATVLQHGWAHINHAPGGEKKCELGSHRPAAVVLDELRRGHGRLTELCAKLFRPVLVPPWNRIAPGVVAGLKAAGFAGLSCDDKPWPGAEPASGLVRIDAHADIVAWHAGRGFLGDGPCIAAILAHLRARRAGTADPAEPTGLLTHHAVHGDDAWRFVERLLGAVRGHKAGRFLGVDAVLSAASSKVA